MAPYASAKLLTNKEFVNWLAEGAEKAAYDPMSWGQHVRRLYQIYEANPDIREEVRAVTEGLTGDSVEPVDWEASESGLPMAKPNANEQAFREVSGNEVSNKLMPTNVDLENRLRSFEVPQIEGDLFAQDQGIAMSPTVLPDEKDREIAMRQAGISGLA